MGKIPVEVCERCGEEDSITAMHQRKSDSAWVHLASNCARGVRADDSEEEYVDDGNVEQVTPQDAGEVGAVNPES